MKWNLVVLFSLIWVGLSAQVCLVQIKVTDAAKKKTLDFASIAYKITTSDQWSGAYTNEKGIAELSLKNGESYDIQVKYLGYQDKTLQWTCNNGNDLINIEMESSSFKIEEIVITEKFPAIVEKQDTTIFNVSEFATGNESKLKEILNRLPGLNVDRENNVTFNGEKVEQILVEKEKFFTGSTSMAAKFIPANAVEKVEVLQRYNNIKVLSGTAINDKLTINIQLKADKKKFIFGEGMAGTNASSRHQLHNSLFYFSPKFTANNISDFSTGREAALSNEELIKVFGANTNEMDPKGNPEQYAEAKKLTTQLVPDQINDRSALLGHQQLKYKFKNNYAGEFIGLGAKNKDFSQKSSFTNFLNIESQQNTNNMANLLNKLGHVDLSFMTDPSANGYLLYNFNHTSNPNELNQNQSNTFLNQSNQLSENRQVNVYKNVHYLSYVQQIREKFQWINNVKYSISKNRLKTITLAKGGLIPDIYIPENLLNIKNNLTNDQASFYFLSRLNYKLNRQSNLNVYYRLTTTQSIFDGNLIQINSGQTNSETLLDQFTNDIRYQNELHITGIRYLITKKLWNLDAGVDGHRVLLSGNKLEKRDALYKIIPNIKFTNNINHFANVILSYTFNYDLPNVAQTSGGYLPINFNQFSVGSPSIRPEENHTVRIMLQRSKLKKGLSGSLALSFTRSLHPIIGNYTQESNTIFQRFSNIDRPSNTFMATFMHMKMKGTDRMVNTLIGSYRTYGQTINGITSDFYNYLISHQLSITKSWKDLEINLGNRFNVLGLPSSDIALAPILNNDAHFSLSYYLSDQLNVSMDPRWVVVKSTYSNQNSFILDAKIKYSFKNEKYKLGLSGYNLTGQNIQNTASVSTIRTQVTAINLFPRYVLFSLTYVY